MRIKKITAGLLAALMCVAGLCLRPVGVSAKSVDQMQSEMDSARAESNRLKAEIAALEKKNAPYQEQLAALRKQVAATEREIELYNSQIRQYENKIKSLEQDIADNEQAIADVKRELGRRLSAIYESGSSSTLALLLSAESLSDYMTKAELLRSITERDQQLVDKMVDELAKIDKKKAELATQIGTLSDAKQIYADKQAELDVQYAKVAKIVRENEDAVKQLEEDKADYDRIISDMKEAIKKAEAEANKPNTPKPTGTFTWPVPGFYRLSDKYGWRICPYHGEEYHSGIDISSSGISGAKIVAADSGTVLLSKYYGGYGNCIMINHGNGYVTLYAHMKSLSAYKVGATVQKGQTIGYVGSSGNSTGPHLHFEVQKTNGSTLNPMSFF